MSFSLLTNKKYIPAEREPGPHGAANRGRERQLRVDWARRTSGAFPVGESEAQYV
ncbi:hypothetical protein B194_2116 [Serratia plymuthica A30]|nr:hypothetical protein B194_2116 [Serratia plymuthica A30]